MTKIRHQRQQTQYEERVRNSKKIDSDSGSGPRLGLRYAFSSA